MAYITSNLNSLILTTDNAPSTANAVPVDDAWALGMVAPSVLTGTITIQVEPSSSGTNFQTLQSAGTDVTITAGKAIVISPFPYKQVTVASAAQEASPRTFTLTKTWFI